MQTLAQHPSAQVAEAIIAPEVVKKWKQGKDCEVSKNKSAGILAPLLSTPLETIHNVRPPTDKPTNVLLYESSSSKQICIYLPLYVLF